MRKSIAIDERFQCSYKVNAETGCWEWQKQKNRLGYGQFSTPPGTTKYAHRWAHLRFKGPIPPGHVVMHLCDNPPCVNPDHLKAATQKENMQDCLKKGRYEYQKHATHCKYGHEMTGYNVVPETRTYRGVTFTQRICRQCKNRNSKLSQARRRQAKKSNDGHGTC